MTAETKLSATKFDPAVADAGAFDAHRLVFLKEVMSYVFNPAVPDAVKRQEIAATINAIGQMAALAGIPHA